MEVMVVAILQYAVREGPPSLADILSWSPTRTSGFLDMKFKYPLPPNSNTLGKHNSSIESDKSTHLEHTGSLFARLAQIPK